MRRQNNRAVSLAEALVVTGLVAIIGNILSLSVSLFVFQTDRWENLKLAKIVAIEHHESVCPAVFSKDLGKTDTLKVVKENRVYRLHTTVSAVPGLDSDRLRELRVRCEWEGPRSGFYEKRARLLSAGPADGSLGSTHGSLSGGDS